MSLALASAALSVFAVVPQGQALSTVKVGVALPGENSMLGLPAIAESLSSETLVGLGLDGRPFSRLAERWRTSEDGRDLSFVLSPNLRLHNGRRANAVTIAALLKDALKSSGVLRFHPRLNDFYEIKPDGDSTVLLRSRSARLLAIAELADATLRTGAPDAGLGPFVVESLTAETIRLRGFQDYFKGPPPIRRLEFHAYRSQRAAWTGMMRDEIDALYELNREAVAFVERGSRVRTYSFLRPYVSGVVFNVARPVLRDPQVRRALAAAINRSAIVEGAYRGRALRADGPLAPTYWALAGSPSQRTYDPKLASSLLEPFSAESSPSEMPARLRFRCLVPIFETQPLERTALLVQKQLYDVGVDVQLELISLQKLIPRLASGDFDAVLMEFFGVTPSWVSFFWHSPMPGTPVLIKSGYAAADAELDAMVNARTEDDLRQALGAVYRAMSADPPAIFIAWPQVTRAVSTRFDIPVEEGRDIMGANLRLWRPARQQ